MRTTKSGTWYPQMNRYYFTYKCSVDIPSNGNTGNHWLRSAHMCVTRPILTPVNPGKAHTTIIFSIPHPKQGNG